MGSLCAKADAIEDEPKEILNVDEIIRQQQVKQQQQIGIVREENSKTDIKPSGLSPVKSRANTCPPGPVPQTAGTVSFRMMSRARSGTGPPRRRRPVYSSFTRSENEPQQQNEQRPLKAIPEDEATSKYRRFAQIHDLSINLAVMGAAPGNPATAKYVPRRLPQQVAPPKVNPKEVPPPETESPPAGEAKEEAAPLPAAKPLMIRKRRPSKFVYNSTIAGNVNRPRTRSILGQPALDIDELSRRL
eukprot:TRINITY_DN4882_c1_g2_i1.p1 TRINITY_DN4882_c1_g2~~TRINITY_DN4882_c1_g2_i1.p1  ORF type:complete len:261 (+),score=68.72 TRINITY_DN4882_c1_g2_i1:49-783(+)